MLFSFSRHSPPASAPQGDTQRWSPFLQIAELTTQGSPALLGSEGTSQIRGSGAGRARAGWVGRQTGAVLLPHCPGLSPQRYDCESKWVCVCLDSRVWPPSDDHTTSQAIFWFPLAPTSCLCYTGIPSPKDSLAFPKDQNSVINCLWAFTTNLLEVKESVLSK